MIRKGIIAACGFLVSQLLTNCQRNPEPKSDSLFKLLSSQYTHVTFANTITTDDSVNILTYEYLYNGGGVGIADFNNDSLPDIFLSGQMVPSKLYINKGNFVFEDLTTKSGIDTKDSWAYGVSIIDINQDGWQDIYLCAGGMGNRFKDIYSNKLYINKRNLTFEESSASYGLAIAGESIQGTFFDYDRDGDLDLYLMKGGGFERSAVTAFPIINNGSSRNTDKLLRNDSDRTLGHPKFTDVSSEAGILLEGYGLGVSVVDVNRDHWPDIYVSNDYLSKDHLYINNRNGTFTDRVDNYFKHMSHFAMGNDVGDINNDGLSDIVTVDMLPEDNYHRKLMFGPNQYDKFYFAVKQGYGYQYMRNTLQLANQDGSFSEVGQFAGIDRTNWSWAPLLADFDNDGFQDLVITNGYGKDVTNLDYVKFRQPSAELTTEQRRKVLLDRPAIVLPNYAYKNNRNSTFTNVSREWGFDQPSLSSGMAYADFDRDGDLDLVINNIDLEAFVYKNTLREKKTTDTNFIRVKLTGPATNRDGLGAEVVVQSDSLRQVRSFNPVHGFESSVEGILHFGLGKHLKIDSITVTWGDGQMSRVLQPAVNATVELSYADSRPAGKSAPVVRHTVMSRVDKIRFKHEEDEYNDFTYQPLMQHKLSQEGPGIAVGDVNKDGLEDIFIGGAYRLPAHFILQDDKGNFSVKEFAKDFESEDMGALFFDADNDADQDLYVVSGGFEFYDGHRFYRDRLYRNDGRGNFTKDSLALPKAFTSGSCVIAGDYDSDGDLDLFVGGRVLPERYPAAPRSYVLRNDGGKFTDVTLEAAPTLAETGMVASALWTDFDNDNSLDLIVTGEAMPIRFFKNRAGRFEDITVTSGLGDSDGFWNGLVSGDFDNDGDIDYVAGNLGLNGPMHASLKEPVTIRYADFDGNGSTEPIVGYFGEGVLYPIHGLDILTSRLPGLKKTILHHKDYAASSMDELITMTGNKNYKTLFCKVLTSSFIRNNGNGKFDLVPLPQQAQLAPVYGMLAEDINGDGNLDLLGVGNSYAPEIVYGRFDALRGLTFLGDGKGNFQFISPEESGFEVIGDAKAIARVETPKGSLFVVTQNNDSLMTFMNNAGHVRSRIKVNQNEAFAILFQKGQSRRQEVNFGSTYLSQSSRTIPVNEGVESVQLFDNRGKVSRKMDFSAHTLSNK